MYLAIINEILNYFTALILDLGQFYLWDYILVVSNDLKFNDDKMMLLVQVTAPNFQCLSGQKGV